ncbi:GIY-YIG family nuclease [uncultured virus]|nr:GIY-YIG family nuclease [uncultured virus]
MSTQAHASSQASPLATWNVYLIASTTTNKTYIGASNDVSKRIATHNKSKGAKATRNQQWQLVLMLTGLTKTSALSFEKIWQKRCKSGSVSTTQLKQALEANTTQVNPSYHLINAVLESSPSHTITRRLHVLIWLINNIRYVTDANKFTTSAAVISKSITVPFQDYAAARFAN